MTTIVRNADSAATPSTTRASNTFPLILVITVLLTIVTFIDIIMTRPTPAMATPSTLESAASIPSGVVLPQPSADVATSNADPHRPKGSPNSPDNGPLCSFLCRWWPWKCS